MSDIPSPQGRPSQLKTLVMLIGGAVAAGLLVGAVVVFATREAPPPSTASESSGFDIATVPKIAPDASDAGVSVRPAQPSGLTMVVGKLDPSAGALPAERPAPAPRTPLEQAAAGFREAIRGSEKTLAELARLYTARYPAIQSYGRDWMSYPDLKKLNDDYMRDHDPVAFLRGLAASPSFPKLARKYAGEPAIRAFVQDCLAKAPPQAVGASMDYLAKDQTLDAFVQRVAGQAGVPPALLKASSTADGGRGN